MQQALYNNIDSTSITGNGIGSQTNAAKTAGVSAPRTAGLLRWVAHRWDLVGVLALMGSSAAYGVFALAHVGL